MGAADHLDPKGAQCSYWAFEIVEMKAIHPEVVNGLIVFAEINKGRIGNSNQDLKFVMVKSVL